ncbi:MAG: T9SS type A sorting domain-containing protein [Bacteroidota bacterium]
MSSEKESYFVYIKQLVLILLITVTVPATFGQGQESMKKIGESSRVSYVMYTDNDGDLYYVNIENHYLDLMKYDLANDTVIKISDNFIDDRSSSGRVRNEGFGAIAPTVTGDTVYCMTTAGSGSGYADIFRLVCSKDTLEHVTQICGEAYWMIFNLTLSKDGKYLYYISNNASVSRKALYKVDIATKFCRKILELGSILPNKDLCFGGINVWDNYNNLYLPVWKYNSNQNDPNDNTLAVLKVHVDGDNYSAEEIYFTENGSLGGTPLFPGFRNNSCWSGIGASSNGDIYIAASNHYQSSTGTGEHGNVAIYKYEPDNDEMKLLGDLKSVSENVDNWMQGESQHKVHTFIMENSDGKMYFATDDYYPSHFLRGSHIYTINTETDELVDYSKTQPWVMKRDFSLVENTDYASETSGIFAEYYGIKGMSLNRNVPEVLYAMTFSNPGGIADPGHIIKHRIESSISSVINTRLKKLEVNIYPNPFAGQVRFEFNSLNSGEQPVLKIFDINGRILYEKVVPGNGTVSWSGKDSGGRELSPGLYLYRISSESVIIGKIMKIK